MHFFKVIFFLALFNGPISQGTTNGSIVDSPDVVGLYKKHCNCIVKVKYSRDNGPIYTSGFFVSDTGHILTSVVGGKNFSIQIANGQWTCAEKLGEDSITSICLLKADCGKTPVCFFPLMRGYEWPSIGQSLVSLSCKIGGNVSPQYGFVTSFSDRYFGIEWPMTLVRSNLAIDGGDCGGAVLDTQGNLQGMLLHALAETKETFFMPTCGLQKIFQDLLVFGRVRHCYIGLNTETVFDTVRKATCLKVLKVIPLSPADRSGFKESDVITKINHSAIDSIESFKNFMFLSTPNDICEVEILRNDKPLNLTLVLGEKM